MSEKADSVAASPIEGTVLQITVKRAYDGVSFPIQVDSLWTIRRLKDHLGSQPNIMGRLRVEDVRVVSKGRELTDNQKLVECAISAGDTIYLVNFTARAQQLPPQPSTRVLSPTAGTTSIFGDQHSVGSVPGMPGMDPEMVSQMMNNPLVQNLLDSPEFMQSVLDSNPQIRALRESHPELNQAFQDTQMLREAFQAMRNPNLWREMVRNTDRAMSNIESYPGGHDALRRMYQTVQVPMWEAATSSSGSDNNASETTYELTASEESAPMPNPWSPQATQGSNRPAANPLENLSSPIFGFPSSNSAANNPFLFNNNNAFGSAQTNNNNNNSNSGLGGFNDPQSMANMARLFSAMNNPNALNNNIQSMAQLFNNTTGTATGTGTESQDFETLYQSQLAALSDMGFNDRPKCIDALRRTSGNLNRALDILFSES